MKLFLVSQDPRFDALHDHSDFGAVVQQLGLARAGIFSAKWPPPTDLGTPRGTLKSGLFCCRSCLAVDVVAVTARGRRPVGCRWSRRPRQSQWRRWPPFL
jgi:hypothetical protein